MTTPQLPAFIPVEVCTTVGQAPTVPVQECMNLVRADLLDDGVSAPPSADSGGLAQVVADAKQKGVDLKIVVLDQNPFVDTPLRDIATQVGTEYFPGSTVLVLSPGFAGTYSTQFDRATLEAGQDLARTGDAVQSSKNFVSVINDPDFPWTALTIFIVLAVTASVALVRLLQVRGRRDADAKSAAEQPV